MIQEETTKAVNSIQKATAEVEGGIGVVSNAGSTFGEIEASVGEVSKQNTEVSDSVEQVK
ncbi:hypothetical protein [Terrilactibacillus laevilacticus]|uniref:Methyl-accepting chemotaxis protein n=1 Tax=Terrilactibacillus laevilacticus TaxID=1380157 RepID=A0ABW5PRF5_9BACI